MDDIKASHRRKGPTDIQERTFQFALRVLQLADQLPPTIAGREIARQLIRAGTSVGSNMQEADAAVSKKDFINDVGISRKEARECNYWLKIIRAARLSKHGDLLSLIDESWELVRILSAIVRSARSQSKTNAT